MKNTVYNLTATHRKLVETLDDFHAVVQDPNTTVSWWAVLNVLRNLEKDIQKHASVLDHYRDYYSETHWTVRTVLDTASTAAAELAEQEEILRTRLQCYLAGDRSVAETQLQILSDKLLDNANTIVELEKSVLFKMLSLLAPAQRLKTISEPELRLVGA